MNTRDQLLADIEDFLAQSGMSPSAFGRLAMKDPSFMSRFRAGADVTLITAEKLRLFMRDFRKSRMKGARRPAHA